MQGVPQVYCQDCIVPLTVRHIVTECLTCFNKRFYFNSDTPELSTSFFLAMQNATKMCANFYNNDCNFKGNIDE